MGAKRDGHHLGYRAAGLFRVTAFGSSPDMPGIASKEWASAPLSVMVRLTDSQARHWAPQGLPWVPTSSYGRP